jgi:ParB family chromosome partitioning protein
VLQRAAALHTKYLGGVAVRDCLAITEIRIGDRHRRDLGDLAGLAESIKSRGLLHPIVVRPDHTLIAGYRRLEAVKRLAWETVPVTIVDIDDLILGERDENTLRKDFTPSEAVAIGRLIEHRERELAKERQAEGQKSGGRGRTKLGGKLPPSLVGKTRDRVGAALGMSGRTYERSKAVVEAAERDPSKFGDLPNLMDATGEVWSVDRELRKRQNRSSNGVDSRRGRAIRRTKTPDREALAALKGACDAFVALDFSGLALTQRNEIVRGLTDAIRKLHRVRKRLHCGG